MTNIISAISGQFSKTLILGTFLPTAVFVILGLILVEPMFSYFVGPINPLEFMNTQLVIVISFVTILLSGLLYNLNIPLIRFYEGYPWGNSWLGRLFARHYRSRFVASQVRWKGMRTLVYALEDHGDNAALESQESQSKIIELWRKSGTSINLDYPLEESSVLPTRLGNVIRSFESYPDREYAIAAITLWPRLISKIDKDFAAALNDAKTSFDFMLNSSFLSAALALLILLTGLLHPVPLALPSQGISWLIKIVFFSALSYVLYVLSIGRASSWGTLVKAAFDLYRWDLLKQLGFTDLPQNKQKERELWNDISDQVIFGDSPRVRQADYIPQPTFAKGEPGMRNLDVLKAGTILASEGKIKIRLIVRNTGAQREPIKNVVITDTLPNQYFYEAGSLSTTKRNIFMTGINPYYFHVGDLEYDTSVTLDYCAVVFSAERLTGNKAKVEQPQFPLRQSQGQPKKEIP